MEQKIKPEKWKRNLRIFPIYRAISFDLLFYYTINFLFLTQIKKISASDVVFGNAFYSLFLILCQFPVSIIVDAIGRKKSMVLGNISNAIYLIMILLSKNLVHIIIAELFAAFGFSLKDVADIGLLNSSIPDTNIKGKTYSKLIGKSVSRYYILNSISILISGFIFDINGYIPMSISLTIVIIGFLLSMLFVEPIEEDNSGQKEKQRLRKCAKNYRESLAFILKSKRLRSLILFSSVMMSFLAVMSSYQVNILQSINTPSWAIGIIFAGLELMASFSSKRYNEFHERLKNRSLTILGMWATCICFAIGIVSNIVTFHVIVVITIIISLIIKYMVAGIYYVLIEKYLRNFTTSDIDTKIFSAKLLFNGICRVTLEIIASKILALNSINKAFLIMGFIFGILFISASLYMKGRVGLDPEHYDNT